MTSLTKNDILLRYEELNGFDYKLRITESVVASYIQVTTSASEQFAMKQALEMRDPMLGWAMVMDQDERFYEWCKRVFKKDAIAAYNDRKKTFVVFFMSGISGTDHSSHHMPPACPLCARSCISLNTSPRHVGLGGVPT